MVTAWPVVQNVRLHPQWDICQSMTLEGFNAHPEWRSDPKVPLGPEGKRAVEEPCPGFRTYSTRPSSGGPHERGVFQQGDHVAVPGRRPRGRVCQSFASTVPGRPRESYCGWDIGIPESPRSPTWSTSAGRAYSRPTYHIRVSQDLVQRGHRLCDQPGQDPQSGRYTPTRAPPGSRCRIPISQGRPRSRTTFPSSSRTWRCEPERN